MGLPINISAFAELDLAIQYRWYFEHGGCDIAEAFIETKHSPHHLLDQQPSHYDRLHFPVAEAIANVESTDLRYAA